MDCPPKKHSDSTEDTVEYGVCVGAALDNGKVIPKNDTSGTGFGRGLERLLELFPAWFNTWEWKDGHYAEYILDSNQNKQQGQTGFHTFNGKYDYTKVENNLFSSECTTYPTGSCNSKANIEPKPPTAQFVDEQNKPIASNLTITGDSSLNFILRFRAYADHDQMPTVRMAVDWGDGTVAKPNVYQVKGWFKNRKEKCNVPRWSNGNECTSVNGDTCRVRFGDSSAACEEGFYQFTHIYECKSGGAGWDASTKSCSFVPKVQVLDNWGWCNGNIVGGKEEGSWNDNDSDETLKNCRTDNDNVGTGKNNPWTSFGGTVEVKP